MGWGIWGGERNPDLIFLLSCDCRSYIEKAHRGGTLAQQRLEGVFIGYSKNSPSYLIYHPDSGEILSRRYGDVVFNEDERAPKTERDLAPDELEAQLEEMEGTVATVDTMDPGAGEQPVKTDMHGMGHTADGTFIRSTKDRTVAETAKLLGVGAGDYLELLGQYEGWYQELTHTGSKIKKGSDVPVPADYAANAPVVKPVTNLPKRSKKRKGKSTRAARRSNRTRLPPARLINEKALSAMHTQKIDSAALWDKAVQEDRAQSRGWAISEDGLLLTDTAGKLKKPYAEEYGVTDTPSTTQQLTAGRIPQRGGMQSS